MALLHLEPSFEYETVPKLAAHAFLKAKVKNDTDYALLEGPANVFLDNNFVSKVGNSKEPSETVKNNLCVCVGFRLV